MGFLRLGFITILLSDPLISGFTTGAAFWVFTSQVKHIIAIYPERDSGHFSLIKVCWGYTVLSIDVCLDLIVYHSYNKNSYRG